MVGKVIKAWITSLASSPLFYLILMLGVLAMVVTFPGPPDSVKAWFGIETKTSLKQELTIEKANNLVLVGVGKQDKADIQILEKTSENVQVAIESKDKAATKVKEKVEKIISRSEAKVEKIQKEDLPQEEIDIKVSQERMQSIWDTYCEFNESNECTAVDSTTPQGA